MSEWIEKPLSALAEIRVSNVDKKSFLGEEAVLLCNYMDAYTNDYIYSHISFMEATASLGEITKFKVDCGDVVITKDSETPDDIGIPAVVMERITGLVCGYHLALLKTKQELIDPVFLCKQLSSERVSRYFGQRAAGSTRYGLSNSALANTPIPMFKLANQKKIAAILISLDKTIEKTEALIAKYQQIKAGLMHDLFTRGVLPNGQLRPPRSEAPELYHETELGWIPREWEVTSLRTCLINSPTNGIYKSADQIGEEGVLMIGQTAFTADRSVDFSLCRRGNVSFEDIRRYGLSMGDILVTRVFATVQGVGLPTLVPKLPEPAVYESNMMRLQVNSRHMLPEFLFEWLRFPIARKYVYAGANASNQCSVNQGVLNPMPIPRPDEKEQEKLVARIQHFDKYLFSERDSLENLKNQKRGLMQDLLTGKVPVKVEEPNTEVIA